jgi:WD40 repeat protein
VRSDDVPGGPPACLVVLLIFGLVLAPDGLAGRGRTEPMRRSTLREIRVDRFPGAILSLDVGSNSNLVAALSDLRVHVWDLESGESLHEFPFPEPPTEARQKLASEIEPIHVRFSPDGKTLAVSFLSRIYLYEVGSWREIQTLGVAGEDTMRPRPTPQLEKRPDSGQKSEEKPSPNLNRAMHDWLETKRQGDGRTRITDFKFTSDGSFILAAYCRGSCYKIPGRFVGASPTGNDPVRLWEVNSGRLLWERVLDPDGVVERVVPAPDGRRFAVAETKPGLCAVGVYDLKDGHVAFSLPWISFAGIAPTLRFTPDSRYLLTFHAEEGPIKFVGGRVKYIPWAHLALYEVSDGKITEAFPGKDEVRDSDLTGDGRWLVSTNWRGLRFQIWNVEERKPLIMATPKEWKWHGPPIDRVRFSPDGRRLIVGSDSAGMLAVFQFDP